VTDKVQQLNNPKRNFSLLHHVQTGSGTHPAFYPMDTLAIPPLPHTYYGMVFNNFTVLHVMK
jgi:hypothetical protein